MICLAWDCLRRQARQSAALGWGFLRAPGIGKRCLEYVRYIAEIATQKNFAAHHGQPARLEAWLDPAIDDRFGGCYSSTLKTMQSAWIRPRYSGYLAFQASAGQLIERHLRGALQEPELLDELLRLWDTANT